MRSCMHETRMLGRVLASAMSWAMRRAWRMAMVAAVSRLGVRCLGWECGPAVSGLGVRPWWERRRVCGWGFAACGNLGL